MSSVFSPSLPTDGYHTCYWRTERQSLALVQAAIRAGPNTAICDAMNRQKVLELSYRPELKAYKVFALPDWETPACIFPHQDDHFDQHDDAQSANYGRGRLTSVSSLMHLLPPRQYIDNSLTRLQVRAPLELREQMVMRVISTSLP